MGERAGTGVAMPLDFTGECFVPGKAPPRMEADHVARYEFAARHASGRSVLDIACGAGYGSAMLAHAGAVHVDAVDLSEPAIAHARKHYAHDAIDFQVGDIYRFDTATRFDLIVSFETIEHVDDYHAALRNLARLLRPGGHLIVSSPNRPLTSPHARTLHDKPGNSYHVHEFTIDELTAALVQHGFSVPPGSVYGQRQQPVFAFAPLNHLYRALFKPKRRADPAVTAVERLAPRYMVIVAQAPGADPPA
jgi:SAM-dependent methyltransferase